MLVSLRGDKDCGLSAGQDDNTSPTSGNCSACEEFVPLCIERM